ncbi:hypothetical protein MNEG_7927 [Monoraphidium neglectum]|uniref:Uncharacterized protein n=1 Tax=Monoraphidium neglectum TaxID=145388 RepID=A0A0D2N177_9CHLO|nr:hypothetical protein MNEG_7927 [Monoraphidium neglectum]KIZ00036.1 hypothetical protein MNEG_7927 [Monoraphidium neglectum]|eukprot:XP_013899055.1 hypothetical protein MNEG_7927 [Monoraphidium neglectum]
MPILGSSAGIDGSAAGGSTRGGADGGSGGAQCVRFADEATASGSESLSLSMSRSSSGSVLGMVAAPTSALRRAESSPLVHAYGGEGSSTGCGSGSGSGSSSGGGASPADSSTSEASSDRGDGPGGGDSGANARRMDSASVHSSRSFASFARLFMGERVSITRPPAAAGGQPACDCASYVSYGGEPASRGCGRCRNGGGGGGGAAGANTGGGGGSADVASWLAWRWPGGTAAPGADGVAQPIAWDPAEDLPQPEPAAAAAGRLSLASRARAHLKSAAAAAARAARPRPGTWAFAAARAAARAAGLGSALLTAPLDVLEAWLVMALRPPPYRHVGHQLILTHQGLRPQVAPLQAYNRYAGDAWSFNRELALVVFREHSIIFYKRRLAALVGAAVERAGGGAAAAAAAVAAAAAGGGRD